MASSIDTHNIQQAFDDLRQDFRAAKSSRFTPHLRGVSPTGSGADFHYRYERDYLHMIERARHYERDDMVVGQGISRLTSNVLQEGFSPDPDTGDAGLNSLLKDAWQEWAEEPDSCHSEGEFSWYQMERLAFRSVVRDGDIFVLPLMDGTLQFAEGHRARTPTNTKLNVVHGVHLDDRARRKQVWLTREDVGFGSVRRVADVKKYDVRDAEGFRQILQLYFPKRFSQRRGVTALAPCSDTVGQHDDLQFSTLVKAQLASLVVLLEEIEKGGMAGVGGPGLGGGAKDQLEKTTCNPIASIGAGLHFKGAPGHKLTGFTPNIPNEEFFPHSMLLLTFIAVNLDLPVQVLLLDPTKTNFSGWRGAIDQARLRFREFQRDMVSQLHTPVWKWKVRNWLELDSRFDQYRGRDDLRPGRVKWKKPSWPYIEPLKDTQADDLQQTRFINSPTRIQSARGRDWDEVSVEIVRDKGRLIRLAIEEADSINQEHPKAGVTWREILGPGLTSQAATVMQTEVSDEAA